MRKYCLVLLHAHVLGEDGGISHGTWRLTPRYSARVIRLYSRMIWLQDVLGVGTYI